LSMSEGNLKGNKARDQQEDEESGMRAWFGLCVLCSNFPVCRHDWERRLPIWIRTLLLSIRQIHPHQLFMFAVGSSFNSFVSYNPSFQASFILCTSPDFNFGGVNERSGWQSTMTSPFKRLAKVGNLTWSSKISSRYLASSLVFLPSMGNPQMG
jgi:hypothetical protein